MSITHTPTVISRAGPSDLPDVAALYRDAGYGAALAQADTILVAKSDGQLAGVVRLCLEEDVTVLRGMQVRAGFQGQGIGSALLAACLPRLAVRASYCLPYAHLAGFYATAGFQTVASRDLPAFLARRLASYREKGHEVIAMRRAAS